MGHLTQAVTPRDNSKAPALKTPSMKAPDSSDANFFSDRKKVLYSTSFLTGRDGKWIEPYLSNISKEHPSHLFINWQLFEAQLITLFGDPNESRKADQELNNLRMKEIGHVSLCIAGFRSLMSRIEDSRERAYIHVYRRGLASRLLDQLASHPGMFDTLQELMDVTLELDTRYHERNEKRVEIKRRSLLLLGPINLGLLRTHLQRGVTKRRIRRASNFNLQRTSPMLLSSIRTTNLLVMKRRGGLKRGCVLIVVESTQLKNASRDLRTSLGHQEASLASREKPEWGS
ncbi:hypothetical protein O181_058224 [Austropuccinia psidii MF-1]|uniref:Retrotransposon gag domain-containing protein n=1 Tax=Austropuccinia psidii MF-1 TaxID=1389203 RepID=A0A9Q3EC08_9BASI|nr:hypothetical protein [Austropuccinia psidii MF-1]